MNFTNRKIIDISPLISKNIAVFPGDVSFELNTSLDFKKDNHLKLSSMNSTLHLGAHADAPNHYHKNGIGIDQVDLNKYMGPCQVLELHNFDIEEVKTARVLFKTNSFPNPNHWNPDFQALTSEIIQKLHSTGVILVGIDTPSVDPADSKELNTHNAIYKCDMSILEGLLLTDVACDFYDLVALPLKIQEADASPVRAILLK